MAEPGRRHGVPPTMMSGWVGWIAFAGVIMVLLGVFHVLQGLVALFEDGYYQVEKSGLAVQVDYTVWGWVHIVGGVVIAAAGLAVFAGKMWARIVGVLVAMASAIVNVGFLAASPAWSLTMIAMNLLIIWALTAHGREIAE
ncbi:hypothetical protein ACFWUU_25070 [Kribbella sp. NPDC058693]|uniref:DUF7144 domain-containing protein n=1 Tax=Kribbella jiaozuonensis TaxID=2575441 RepID=A0A4U3LI21_9ACTN|nr:hypothetical protein [Kribbella jiaozuonensis]TKK75255.1 hypothetical protein FDA38_33090 [Kribbella jiaozuonensis]